MASARRRFELFDDHSDYVDRFGLLLFITTLAVVTLSLVDFGTGLTTVEAEVSATLVTVFVGATLLLALRASGVARRWRMVADVVIGVGLAAILLLLAVTLISGEEPVTSSSGGPSAVWVVLTVIAPIVVIRRLFKHQQVSVATLLGAVSAFLLIATAFGFVFLTVDAYQTTPFFGTEEPTTSFMYYSLVTITTLGYGDLAAATDLGRLASTTEAVIGQVYLVTVVAMIVGLLAQARQAVRS